MSDVLKILYRAFTAYDRLNSRRRDYNPYALAQYFAAAEDIAVAINKGTPMGEACIARLNGKLLDIALNALGEAKATPDERK
jgi:hypothetical protein